MRIVWAVLFALLAATARAACLGPSSCRSSDGKGGTDCYAGNGDPFRCGQTESRCGQSSSAPCWAAMLSGRSTVHEGKTYYHYDCCGVTAPMCRSDTCTSPNGRGGRDCWAAKENGEDYTCSTGTPVLTGDNPTYASGRWWNKYVCCTFPAPPHPLALPSPPPGVGVGVYIGVGVGVALILLIVIIVLQCRKKKPPSTTPPTTTPVPPPQATVPVPMAQPVFAVQQGVAMQPNQPQSPPKFDPETGNPIQGGGAKFDPLTGKPIPKFDPMTGEQNWV